MCDGVGDRVFNVADDICRELINRAGGQVLYRAQQTLVAFLDQVQNVDPIVCVLTRGSVSCCAAWARG